MDGNLRAGCCALCRLTQAIAVGLGAPGGAEGGAFRSAAEVALGALRARRWGGAWAVDARTCVRTHVHTCMHMCTQTRTHTDIQDGTRRLAGTYAALGCTGLPH